VKLFGGRVVTGQGEPGEVLRTDGELVIAAVRDAVAITEVQPAGKERMPAEDWVRGRRLAVGLRFV
jgi:methionyl-tRNA formyltransferase